MMELTDLFSEMTSPCAAASVDELDKMLRVAYYGGYTNLKRFVCKAAPGEVCWEQVRHLRITGYSRAAHELGITMLDGSQYFYTSADGSWLLIVTETPQPEVYFEYCGRMLESLWILGTEISALPGLGNLMQLTKLDLSWCSSLTELPGLGNLTQLTELDLSGCESLSQLPGLGNLTLLTSLSLFGCSSLTELPWLGNLTRLTNLDLSECSSLTELPWLGNLTQLTFLDLSECSSLTELPGLGNLSQITSLNLDRCESLIELPGLGNLTQLTSLNLDRCESLTELDLDGCRSLTELRGLNNLKQLTALNLSGCRSLTKLPRLGALERLIYLNLTECRSLSELNLFGCSSLTELPGLGNLTQLTSLDLSWCASLTELPGLGNLTQLTKLGLSGCDFLTELPAELRHIKSLRLLNLRNLKLRSLPDWLPDIAERFSIKQVMMGEHGKNKAIVYLNNTTVADIPDMSIFEQPYEMVADFFRKRAMGQTHPLNEIKVVFLGDGEAGKSHTIARVMNDGGEPDYLDFDGQSTPGIVIRNKVYDLGDRKITVHYWDFGGQEIMHSMHRIFLTGRTMYVILLNARDDTQSDRAKYWLHNVKSFAPDAPVLLVLNKIDQNEKASVDETDLRGRYEKLTQVVKLSALKYSQDKFNKEFTAVLLDEIQKTGFLDALWPIAWTQVKEKLENMESHYIMGGDYRALCRECQVNDNQKNLLHWFNDLGVSFCCDGEDDYTLEDYVILRPDWITNALYIILFNTLAGARNGLIPHKSIYNLLRNACDNPEIRCTLPQARYTIGDIDYVLRIMRKFNLSFTDGHENEFIPMLCQQNSMVDVQYYQKDAEILEFNMDFDYLPNNLLHRLMVERCGELDMTTVWRTGARFQLKELGYSAVVVIDSNTLRFFIRHTDEMHRPNTYLTMLKAHVDRIVAKMGLKAPACQLVYKLDGKRDEFDYEELKMLQEVGQHLALSKAWRRMIPITDILNQSAPDGLVDEKKLLDAIRESCLHILGEKSYYGSDEDTRNRRIRDDLELLGYKVQDQTQRGLSGTGKGVGELDLLVYSERNEPWAIIEALRVSSGATTDWDKHLSKLVGNYNYFGAPCVYLLTYVDADEDKFRKIWEKYQRYIPTIETYCDKSLAVLDDPKSPRAIKTAKCRYDNGSEKTTAYHIFVRVPKQNG